tara:strand:- start:27 stop:320 length:294 start_codon:yes stop_codon:yes gene_type:complete
MKTKFLLFQNANNDCLAYPVDRLKDVEGKNGTIVMSFDAPSGETTITLTTSDEFTALKDIAEAIGGNNVQSDGVVVIADDVAGTYISSEITDIDSVA